MAPKEVVPAAEWGTPMSFFISLFLVFLCLIVALDSSERRAHIAFFGC